MTYELINTETSNTLAAYDDRDEALTEYEAVTREDRAHRDSYVVVEFDDTGDAHGLIAGPAVMVVERGVVAGMRKATKFRQSSRSGTRR